MESESVNRLSRKNKRGVSPIIATILLVAITVVLAAVLYILVTGLLTHTSTTSSIGLSAGTPATCTDTSGTPHTWNTFPVTIASTTSTISTANFGLKIIPAGSSNPLTLGSASGTTFGSCPGDYPTVTGGYVVVLENAAGAPAGVWSSSITNGGWGTLTAPSTALPSVTIQGGMTLVVVSDPTIATTQASLQVYGLGGASITGSETI